MPDRCPRYIVSMRYTDREPGRYYITRNQDFAGGRLDCGRRYQENQETSFLL